MTPRISSSCFRLVDIVGCVTPQASAARPKWRSLARASNSSSLSIKNTPNVFKNNEYHGLPHAKSGQQSHIVGKAPAVNTGARRPCRRRLLQFDIKRYQFRIDRLSLSQHETALLIPST